MSDFLIIISEMFQGIWLEILTGLSNPEIRNIIVFNLFLYFFIIVGFVFNIIVTIFFILDTIKNNILYLRSFFINRGVKQ